MSISVDDLVASLASNHIGQEQIDIATLQSQLAQTLMYQQQQQQQQRNTETHYAPCNTPIARTPSTSAWADPAWSRSRVRSSSVASTASVRRGNIDRGDDIMEESMEDDDEAAVERLVGGSASPTARQRAGSVAQYASPHAPMLAHASHSRAPSHLSHAHGSTYTSPHGYESMSTSPTQSSFATTDPFYASVQASAANQTHQTSFLQHAWPSQQSPFFQPQNHGINASYPLQVDTRSHSRPRYVAAGCMDS